MCGILGISGPDGPELLARHLGELQHRGPDDEGMWFSPELSLGHRRLSIIGLSSGGRQPMASRSGSSLVVFNGEIYNYLELADALEKEGHIVDRRFDTAVLLAALEAWGTDALARLNGMFAFGWYRLRERRLMLARDRWGKKPLFWGRVRTSSDAQSLVFSSDLRTFRSLPGGPPPPDALGIARFLAYDGMPGTRTVYSGVSKVPAAGWVELTAEGVVTRSGAYWRHMPAPRGVMISAEEAGEELTSRLQRAVLLRLRSDVPVGLFLSGGIDSSLLATLWRDLETNIPLRTFCVGFDDPSYDERKAAERVAKHCGSEHFEMVLAGRDLERGLEELWQHLSEPFSDPSILPFSMLCKFARQHVTVGLGGDGGDELQAGYDPFRAWVPSRVLESVLPRRLLHFCGGAFARAIGPDARNMSLPFKLHHFSRGFLHPPRERIQAWMAPFLPGEIPRFLEPDLASEVEADEIFAPTREAYEEAGHGPELHRQIHTWIRTYLEANILTKLDRAGMMHSLEVRSPFLDPDVASFLLELPPELIWRRGRGKVLLRELAVRRLPSEIVARPKKGFGVPQAHWLRTILRGRFEEALEYNRNGGWFAPRAIEALWKEHLEGRADHRRALWTFLFAHPFQFQHGAD